MLERQDTDTLPDGTVAFLPHRLNRQPVVVRGLTADELWICAGLSAVVGLLLGIPLAWLISSIAVVPTLIVAAVTLGIFVGGGLLRRHKRGRPNTWLYRELQWRIARCYPALVPFVGATALVTRSGDWTTRRSTAS
ncbi:TIGR03750 family conjugal transfer protein [Billgrantia endophytica]|uniref:TIGR03750 family conjugal transfer protein n=1 Tax=Billgrantia endophytica TaxID=2033802 RepID=A0A2N7U4B6_9GAMM|nr:TIGR03750 family conjugal transfer protein [Halomonas endophytica]PMR75272.1 TIGR03750 family conjugal transfer protein [Halomonas endophytica]